jgi:hypothetical protein
VGKGGKKLRQWIEMSHGCCSFLEEGIPAEIFLRLLIITSEDVHGVEITMVKFLDVDVEAP